MSHNNPLPPEDRKRVDDLVLRLNRFTYLSAFIIAICLLMIMAPEAMENALMAEEEVVDSTAVVTEADTLIVDGVHVSSGLIVADGWEIVRVRCIRCHTAQTITQNKLTRDGWDEAIKWMQETQGLEDLGDHHPIILDYLEKNYAPTKKGRRANLTDIEWYDLEEE